MDTYLPNTRVKDSSAKTIFGDSVLCAQFLRGYLDIPLLKEVRAEDIEDVTHRFVHMFTEERNSDVVKRVHIKDKEMPCYLISLIEHKSDVDYNVVMQIFRYMAFIWEDYEKEREKQQEGISKTKNFRYPPILPIIFYDGLGDWTAATRFQDRILLNDVFGEYIPDYRCMLVQLKDYSNAQLMERQDELSILMMMDKIRNMAEFVDLSEEVKPEWLTDITKQSPEYLLKVMVQVIEGLLAKLNVPLEEAEAFTKQIKERRMGEWFSNFQGFDVQATRREIRKEVQEEVRKEVEEEVRKEVEEEVRKEERKEVRQEDIEKLIKFGKKHGISKKDIKEELKDEYFLEEDEAAEKTEMYW